MIETIMAKLTWETGAAIVGGAWALWRARKVHKALQEWGEFQKVVRDARSESSPGGKTFTQEEVERIVDEGGDVLKSLAPIFGRIFAAK